MSMKIDVFPAFNGGNRGLSIWSLDDGRYQANVKSPEGGFMIGYGDTPQEALDDVWVRSALPTLKPRNRRRLSDII